MQINFFMGHYGFLIGGDPDWDANASMGVLQLILFVFVAVVFVKYQQQVIDDFYVGAVILVVSSLVYVPQLLEAASKLQHKKYAFTKTGIYDFSSERNVIKLGSKISFKDTGNSEKYRTYGWSRTEYWGTSSIGHESGIFLNPGGENYGTLLLEFTASGYVYDNWQQQQIDIVVNGRVVDKLAIEDKQKHTYQVKIPPPGRGDSRLLDIAFRYRTPVKLSEIGASGDTRLHAIDMIDIRVSRIMPTQDSDK